MHSCVCVVVCVCLTAWSVAHDDWIRLVRVCLVAQTASDILLALCAYLLVPGLIGQFDVESLRQSTHVDLLLFVSQRRLSPLLIR